jgi:hypothetical protein
VPDGDFPICRTTIAVAQSCLYGLRPCWRARALGTGTWTSPSDFPHNSYYLWSAGHTDADVLIAVGANPRDLKLLFRESAPVDEVHCEYCMSWRARMPIYVARQPIVPLNTLWARMRHYE